MLIYFYNQTQPSPKQPRWFSDGMVVVVVMGIGIVESVESRGDNEGWRWGVEEEGDDNHDQDDYLVKGEGSELIR